MKKLLLALFSCILLAPIAVFATTVEPEMPASLTLVYKDSERAYSGLTVKTYRIADVSADGTYTLCGDFKDYPVSLWDIPSQAEWNSIASTLASYAIADNIAPSLMAETDAAGTVTHQALRPGMYLTLSVKYEDEVQILIFESFLTAIPQPAGDGTYNYHVTAYPKNTKHTPTPAEISYKVVKQWKDGGQGALRPKAITVDIYKDGQLHTAVTLSGENSWMYEWTAPDDGGKWTAVERNIPADYTVSITREGTAIILTNIYTGEIDVPQTGDTVNVELYAVILCISGFMVILLSLLKKRWEV